MQLAESLNGVYVRNKYFSTDKISRVDMSYELEFTFLCSTKLTLMIFKLLKSAQIYCPRKKNGRATVLNIFRFPGAPCQHAAPVIQQVSCSGGAFCFNLTLGKTCMLARGHARAYVPCAVVPVLCCLLLHVLA